MIVALHAVVREFLCTSLSLPSGHMLPRHSQQIDVRCTPPLTQASPSRAPTECVCVRVFSSVQFHHMQVYVTPPQSRHTTAP